MLLCSHCNCHCVVSVEEIRRLAMLYALQNAARHGKPPMAGAVMGKLMGEHPELRGRAREVKHVVEEVVAEVASLAPERWRGELEKLAPELIEELSVKKEPRKGLKELPNAIKGEVVMRFAPNPNGPPTLGSARGIVVNSEYAKMYEGKFILRFDDTDPVQKKPLPDAYRWYIEDCRWLGAQPDEVYCASDRLELYYEVAERLIEAGHAYMCLCSREEFKRHKDACQPCPHRDTPPEESMRAWQDALDGELPAGSAVLRIKTDITHSDPALRDFGAFRIVDAEHPRVGDRYRVWPLLDFESAVEDHLLGITHIIRGKDLMDAERRQRYIYRYLGWEYPVVLHWGRVKIHEFGRLSTSSIARSISEGTYEGWDDVRLPTIRALRRRGIQAEAIRRLFLDLGVGESDISISLENLYAENRKLIDPEAARLFFVKRPEKVEIQGAVDAVAQPPLYPDGRERRRIPVPAGGGVARLYLEQDELASFTEGEVVRLKDLYTVRMEGGGLHFVSHEMHGKPKIVHWVPEDGIPCVLRTPEGDLEGIAEREVREHVGEVVQFERVGFARIDSANGKVIAYFAHR